MGAEQRFAFRFRKERERRGMSQGEVARRLERLGVRIDGSAITRIENGQRAIKLDEASALASIVDRPLQELMAPDFSPREVMAKSAVTLEEDARLAEHSAGQARDAVAAWLDDCAATGRFSQPHADETLAKIYRAKTLVLAVMASTTSAEEALTAAGAADLTGMGALRG